jgi:CHAT domain-containing protein
VYLSACSTVESKAVRLWDEVIHVVGRFQVAGFPHIVGCLRCAGDSERDDSTRWYYSGTSRATGNCEVALVLQEAMMAVRAENINMPLNWAQFVRYEV